MCTLSWLHEDNDYALWFNRDELHTRAVERPPQLRRSLEGVEFLAPSDPDSGGTWLMVNAHGVTCVLLNWYAEGVIPLDEAPPGDRPSRGRLVPLTVDCTTVDEAIEAVRQEPLDGTPGFLFVALDPRGGVSELRWDGVAGHMASGEDVVPPISSSSFRAVEVQAARRDQFPALRSFEALEEFHHAHDPEDGAISVNMCRDDASTRSITRVWVKADRVELDYQPQGWSVINPAPASRYQLNRTRPASLAR